MVLQIDRAVPSLVVKSTFQTAAYAGFPNVSFLINSETLEAHPGMEAVIEQAQAGLTTEVMQELNSRVDLDKEKPADVAAAYLSESGLVE